MKRAANTAEALMATTENAANAMAGSPSVKDAGGA